MLVIFRNVLSNAIKFSQQNGNISITGHCSGKEVHIEIEDRGIGIPEDQLSKIFEKFYRIDNEKSISGTGLGLTVVKEVVEAHNGKVLVTSELDKGSKFSIILNHQQG